MIKLNLKTKLISYFLLIGVIPLLTSALFSFLAGQNMLEEEIQSKFNIYTSDKQNLLATWFENQQKTINILASTQDVYQTLNLYYIFQGGSEWAFQERTVLLPLLEKIKKENGYRDLFITNEQGVIVSSTNKGLLNQNLDRREYIRRSLRGEVTTSDIFYSELVKSNIVTISAPIYDDPVNGRVYGVLAAYFDSNQITEMILSGLDNVGKTADGYFVNENGLLLTVPKFGQEIEILKTKLENKGVDKVATALREKNWEIDEVLFFRNHLGKQVLGRIKVFNLGAYPVGFVTTIDYDEAFSSVKTLQRVYIIVAIIFSLVIAFFGAFVAISLTKPLLQINEGMKEIASGNLTVRVENNRQDELGDLAKEQNKMTQQIADMIRQILSSSHHVNQASQEIAKSTQELSNRTEKQAATLEEITATIKEMNSSIQQVANNSDKADQLAKTSLQVVTKGKDFVEETIKAMADITASSKQIAEINQVVNDIAFQTNLLALNAAVEAARAGEQGRGFAVVAAEVRNLAGRTAESAKEIEKLINESVIRVERGNKLVQDSSEMLEAIVRNSKQTSELIIEVASALRAQSSASEQISSSIDNLNQATQENAAMVEEITSSCQALYAEVETLRSIVDTFKVQDDSGVSVIPPEQKGVTSKRSLAPVAEPLQNRFQNDRIDQF
ncbi:MAG TPA: methyl-accepting chemotaxis protein [Capillibacterium sp.]